MSAFPLRAATALPATVTADCHNCSGSGERTRIINLRWQQDEQRIPCSACAGTGKLVWQVGEVDGDIFGYCERTGELSSLDDLEALYAGAPTDAWPANPRTIRDDEILEACGVEL